MQSTTLSESGSAGGTASDPRICLVSQRGLTRQAARCSGYEFEDVVAEIDAVRLVMPTHSRTSNIRLKVRNKTSYYTDLYKKLGTGLKHRESENKYSLFFMVVQFARDLIMYDAVRDVRKKSDVAVCYIEELWHSDIDRLGPQLMIFKEFDYIFCGCSASVEKLSQKIGRPVEYMPPAIDGVRFAPKPEVTRRCIDVMGIGRRSPVTHKALVSYAVEKKKFYLYDTFEPPMIVRDQREHRILLANQIKNSTFFIANSAKVNRTFETAGQAEIGLRFFEGLAGGAVLLGDYPDTDKFRELLGWEDSVIRIPFDCPHIADIVEEILSEPARVEMISRRNVKNILERHDYLHRWETILDRVKLPKSAAMEARRAELLRLERSFELPAAQFHQAAV